MGLAGAVREAAAVATAVAAAVAVNGGGGGGGEWPSAIAIDGSLGATLALVALALECALFAAVVRFGRGWGVAAALFLRGWMRHWVRRRFWGWRPVAALGVGLRVVGEGQGDGLCGGAPPTVDGALCLLLVALLFFCVCECGLHGGSLTTFQSHGDVLSVARGGCSGFFCGACPLPFLVRRFSRHVCYGHCPPPPPLFPPPSRCRIQIVQTASTEPGTHVPLSRSFTLLFGLTAATAGFTAVTTLFGSSSAIAHAAATAACACLAGATLGTLPAAAAVVFPEAHRGTEKTAAFVAGIAAVAAGVAAVTGAGIGAGVAELLPVGGGWLLGGLLGGGGALLLAAAGRATRDLGGRGGAAVLAVAVLAGGGVAALWTWVEPYVEWFFLCGVVSFGRGGGRLRPSRRPYADGARPLAALPGGCVWWPWAAICGGTPQGSGSVSLPPPSGGIAIAAQCPRARVCGP